MVDGDVPGAIQQTHEKADKKPTFKKRDVQLAIDKSHLLLSDKDSPGSQYDATDARFTKRKISIWKLRDPCLRRLREGC